MKYIIFYKKEPDGGFTTLVPSLPGCVSYGDSLEEAKKMTLEAIEGYLELQEQIKQETISDDSETFIDTLFVPIKQKEGVLV